MENLKLLNENYQKVEIIRVKGQQAVYLPATEYQKWMRKVDVIIN